MPETLTSDELMRVHRLSKYNVKHFIYEFFNQLTIKIKHSMFLPCQQIQ